MRVIEERESGTVVREISHATISKCPMFSFDPDHYLPDGSCLCYDKTHQARLRQERKARTKALLKAQAKANSGANNKFLGRHNIKEGNHEGNDNAA
jgi:hypothetical protein